MTPRKVDVPREKPWLCLRTAMMSSSKEMSCMHSVRSAYLRGDTHSVGRGMYKISACWDLKGTHGRDNSSDVDDKRDLLGHWEICLDARPLALQGCHIICLSCMIFPLIAAQVDLKEQAGCSRIHGGLLVWRSRASKHRIDTTGGLFFLGIQTMGKHNPIVSQGFRWMPAAWSDLAISDYGGLPGDQNP